MRFSLRSAPPTRGPASSSSTRRPSTAIRSDHQAVDAGSHDHRIETVCAHRPPPCWHRCAATRWLPSLRAPTPRLRAAAGQRGGRRARRVVRGRAAAAGGQRQSVRQPGLPVHRSGRVVGLVGVLQPHRVDPPVGVQVACLHVRGGGGDGGPA